MIAGHNVMTEEDFDCWIDQDSFFMLSDDIIAVTLTESELTPMVSCKWTSSGDELKMFAGRSCYCRQLDRLEVNGFSEDRKELRIQ